MIVLGALKKFGMEVREGGYRRPFLYSQGLSIKQVAARDTECSRVDIATGIWVSDYLRVTPSEDFESICLLQDHDLEHVYGKVNGNYHAIVLEYIAAAFEMGLHAEDVNYNQGYDDGREAVRTPVLEALGLDEAFDRIKTLEKQIRNQQEVWND